MKTKRIKGQKFVKIRYTQGGVSEVTFYPIENLRWLKSRCDFTFVK